MIPLISDNDLIPVYVSLNGIDSQEKLKKIIYSTLTTTVLLGEIKDDRNLKNVAKKRVKKIMENAQQIVGKIKTDFGDLGQLFKYLNIFEFEDFIVLDDVVFCLDDLERISDDFRIEDLLGFINSEFIEHKNLKVILIGNETKRQLSSEEYAKAKEKVIGWTYDFKTDLQKVTREILMNQKDSLNEKIKENEDYFIELITSFKFENLRTLIFTIDCLNQFLKNVETENKSVIRDIVYFTVLICQEYKKGKLNFLLKEKELPKYIISGKHNWDLSSSIVQGFTEDEKEVVPSDYDIISEEYEKEFSLYLSNKYITFSEFDTSYHFFSSIFNFILTGFLDTKSLTEEIKSYSLSRKNKDSFKHDSPLNQLYLFRMLSEEEFNQNIKKVYEAVKNGDYSLKEFALAFVTLSELISEKLIADTIQELEVFFEKNINKAVDRTKNERIEDTMHLYDTNEKLKAIAPNLFEKIISFEGEIFNYEQNSEAEKGFKNWKDTIDELGTFTLILQKISPEKISEFIFDNINDRKFIQKFYFQLKEAFEGYYVGDKFSHCLPALKKIKLEMKFYDDNFSIGRVGKYWLNLIKKLLDDTIQRMEKST